MWRLSTFARPAADHGVGRKRDARLLLGRRSVRQRRCGGRPRAQADRTGRGHPRYRRRSTRPGAAPVSLDEERQRVLPVLEALPAAASRSRSIRENPQSWKDAISAGVSAHQRCKRAGKIHDRWTWSPSSTAAICLMHKQGEPQTMQRHPALSTTSWGSSRVPREPGPRGLSRGSRTGADRHRSRFWLREGLSTITSRSARFASFVLSGCAGACGTIAQSNAGTADGEVDRRTASMRASRPRFLRFRQGAHDGPGPRCWRDARCTACGVCSARGMRSTRSLFSARNQGRQDDKQIFRH